MLNLENIRNLVENVDCDFIVVNWIENFRYLANGEPAPHDHRARAAAAASELRQQFGITGRRP